jgi:hypothetical protein
MHISLRSILILSSHLRLGIPKGLKSQTRDPRLIAPPGGLVSTGFLRPEEIHIPQPGLNPRTLDVEASTFPRGNVLQ